MYGHKMSNHPIMTYLLTLGITTGCGYMSHPEPARPPVQAQEDTRPLADPIAVGPRPQKIDGADFLTIEQFFTKRGTNLTQEEGDWLAIEGIVEKAFDRFGAPCVVLACPSCFDVVDCEGRQLGEYQFKLDDNTVILGQLHGTRSLVKARIVTQNEIEEAIKNEIQIDSPSTTIKKIGDNSPPINLAPGL